MGFVNKYPYVDFHELNADALIAKVDDASAEAKAAAETVATYNDRLTTVEGDLAPIKAAMPGIASDVSGLKHDVSIMDSLITNTINPELDTLKNEVETPTTGLIDRVTALENQPAPTANAVYYLEFDSSLVVIDPTNAYDSRIKYDWLKQFVPLNISGEDTHVIKLYDSHTQKVYDLAAFHLQESASPDGKFVFTNRAEHTTGGVIDYYVNSTVIVSQNASNPAFAEENEYIDEVRTPFNITAVSTMPISNVLNYSYYTEKELVINATIATTAAMSIGDIALNTDDTTSLSLLGASTTPLMACGYANPSGTPINIYSIFNRPDNQIVLQCLEASIITIYGIFARS